MHRLGLPRPLGLVLATVLLACSIGALTLDGMRPLYVASIGGGLGYGAVNAVFPAVVSEVFEVQLFPVLYTLIGGPAFALGSLLFSTFVYGTTFDTALERHGLDATLPCRFTDCYLPSVQMAAAGSAFAASLWVVFICVTRGITRQHNPGVQGKAPLL